MTKTDIPQADIDELAKWLFNNNGSVNLASWSASHEVSRNRWRAFARRLLSNMPDVVRRYAKEAS